MPCNKFKLLQQENIKTYNPLTTTGLILCVLGIVLGTLFSFCSVISFLIYLPAENPKIIMPGLIIVFVYLAFFFGSLAVILFSICIPKLILGSLKQQITHIKALIIEIGIPLTLSFLLIASTLVIVNVHNNSKYNYPVYVYKGTTFTYIHNKFFYNANKIIGIAPNTKTPEKVELPSEIDGLKVSYIEPCAFKNNKTIKEVVIPDTIEYINDYCFSGCTSLNKVTLGKKVHLIGNYAFSGCVSLKEIKLSKNLNLIQEYAFKNCISLKTISKNQLQKCYIDDTAFYNSPLELKSK